MELKRIGEFEWEIPKSGKMLVPGRIFTSEKMLEKVRDDQSLEQLQNMACLPGIRKHALAMPDAHRGYGFCIGGVAAFSQKEGIISPGGVGYDINCGVRMLRTDLAYDDIKDVRSALLDALFKSIPPGAGRNGIISISRDELLEILAEGSKWALKEGYATKDDIEKTEEYGRMSVKDPTVLSKDALERGQPQIGTLGSGNHFLEIQRVSEIFDGKTAAKFGLTDKDQIVVMIHCGSRGLGHQVASDYIRLMEKKFGYAKLPDRELINAPIDSDLGKEYLEAMSASVNFAFCNRQLIAYHVRETFKKVLGRSVEMKQVYDVCHNIAKIETHHVDGKKERLCVHRKGATRSFGPGRDEIPESYRKIGQPVLIPGSMGTSSYVLVGTEKAEEISFGSTAHGAGRALSRQAALAKYRGQEIVVELKGRNILVKGGSMKGIAEETYQAYKDVDEVVKVSDKLGIGNLVAKLVPSAVMKG